LATHLGKDEFVAYQASTRGGTVRVRVVNENRVVLGGQAVTTLRGELVFAEPEDRRQKTEDRRQETE